MSKKIGLAMASILLGIIWVISRLPLFYITAADTFNQSFPLYLFQVTGLFWKVNGNLLPQANDDWRYSFWLIVNLNKFPETYVLRLAGFHAEGVCS
jgi:hypothetical protein